MMPGVALLLLSSLAWQSAGRIAAALPSLERAHQRDPAQHDAAWNLALAYLETGRLPDARRIINAALARADKTQADWHSLLADVEERSGDPAAAARQHQRAAELDPSEKHLLAFGSHLTKYSATNAALELYTHAVTRHPRSAPLRVGYGVALHAASRHDEAVAALCAAVDLNPADPRAIYFLGELHDVSAALASEVSHRLERFTQLYPRNAAAQHFFALSLLKRNPPALKQAESHLLAASQLDPGNAATWLQLGILHERAGRDAAAEAAWRKAVSLAPDSEQAHYRLGRLYQRTGRNTLAQQELARYQQLHQRKPPAGAALEVK